MHLPALQVVVPMLSAPLAMLLRDRQLSWMLTTAVSFCAFAISIALVQVVLAEGMIEYHMGGWQPPFGIELRVDAMSALLLLLVTGASSFALLAGAASLQTQIEAERQPMFYSAWLLAVSGLCGILVTADAFNVFVFMEISSLASYIIIAGGPDKRALPATFKYLVMGTIGATFYLIGVGLIYMMTGTLNMDDIGQRIGDVADLKPILIAAGFITIGLALKAAIFPLHVWLPNAYTYAPHVVTVFLAACATKVSLYVLIRFDYMIFQPHLPGASLRDFYFLLPLSLLAIVIASSVAMLEGSLKRLLAWSSVAQIGYITLGASLISEAGLTASMLHFFNHALAKGALFLVIACLAMSMTRLHIDALGGIAKRMPWTMAAFVVAGLSLIGVPGTAGFISKWYLITAVLDFETWGAALVIIIVISSLMAVVYIWKIVEVAYFGDHEQPSEVREAPLALLIPTWAVVLMNLYFGFFPDLPYELASTAAAGLMGGTP
jgi:multicomponent Na+:H+ antiporter subunit D